MTVRRVLVIREDGSAWLFASEAFREGGHTDEQERLSPNDLVDGVAVQDWPPGTHAVKSIEYHNPERRTEQ